MRTQWILTIFIVLVSTVTNAQDLQNLPDNLWNFDKRLKTLKQADTVIFVPADFFLVNAWQFSKHGTIDSCAQRPFSERKKGKRKCGVKCEWIKFGTWRTNGDELTITFDKKQITLRAISSTKENTKLVVKSMDSRN